MKNQSSTLFVTRNRSLTRHPLTALALPTKGVVLWECRLRGLDPAGHPSRHRSRPARRHGLAQGDLR